MMETVAPVTVETKLGDTERVVGDGGDDMLVGSGGTSTPPLETVTAPGGADVTTTKATVPTKDGPDSTPPSSFLPSQPTPSTVSTTKKSSTASASSSKGSSAAARHRRVSSDGLAHSTMDYPPTQIVYSNNNNHNTSSTARSNSHGNAGLSPRNEMGLPPMPANPMYGGMPPPMPPYPQQQPQQQQQQQHARQRSWSSGGGGIPPYAGFMMPPLPPPPPGSYSAGFPPYAMSSSPPMFGMAGGTPAPSSPYPMPPPPPSVAYSPAGNPLVPTLHDPNPTMNSTMMYAAGMAAGGGQPPYYPIQQTWSGADYSGGGTITTNNKKTAQPPLPQQVPIGGSTGSSKRKEVPGHRRVHSYSGGGRSYGSLDRANTVTPPLPSYRSTASIRTTNSSRSRSGSADFSPRAEIRKLTAGMSPRRSPVPPLSPMNHNAPASSAGGRGRGSSNGRQDVSPMPHARTYSEDMLMGIAFAQSVPTLPSAPQSDAFSYHNQSPSFQQQPPSQLYQGTPPLVPNRGVYTGLDDDIAAAAVAAMIPPSPRMTSSMRSDRSANNNRGGEAVFLVSERDSSGGGKNSSSRGKKHHGRAASGSRKMHMRQQSAQIFMETVKGEEQLPACRNIFFLLLFVFHLLGMVYLGRTYGYEALTLHDDTQSDVDTSITIRIMNLIYVAGLSGIFAVAVSALTLLLVTSIAKKLIQIALIVAVTFSFAWGTMGVGLSPTWVVPATGLIALLFSVAYAFIVWDRIPFAAANLDAALSGIKDNPGTILIAFVFQFLALGWSVYFTLVAVGVYDAVTEGKIGKTWTGMEYVIYTLLGISYFWTLQVFLNVVQVSVAGVIGSWWNTPSGDTSNRGEDLKRSFFRSCFYSIGSICFGSLVVGPVGVLRQLSGFFRPSSETSSLLCLHQCAHFLQTHLTSCVESLADRFSRWSFTYVGLYGYGLVDAGLHASELFETRGWTTIVSDDLVPNVLSLMSLVIGGVTGLFAYFIAGFDYLSLSSLGVPVMASFVVGALVGLVVSSVLFGIISSSVNAVIVCFAASPVDFQRNHPELSDEMRKAWREVWPGCMEVMDMRVQAATYLDTSMMNGAASSERHPLLP